MKNGLKTMMRTLQKYFDAIGINANTERISVALVAGVITLVLYFVFFGKRHRRRRQLLTKELEEATRKMQELKEKLAEVESEEDEPKKEIRIWMDGAFDMMHYGHMNAFRQGRALGTYLVVGVNDDESINECKGAPPVMDDDERIAAVEGCKFVDRVERHCPYIMNDEYLHKMISKHNIDYVVHGDDPCIVDGKDVYAGAKALGKYRCIPRTEGVSTSDILGRMLLLQKSHHTHNYDGTGKLSSKARLERTSKFLTTNRMLRLFSAGNKDPSNDAKVIYMDGAFDLFHAGHVMALGKAKVLGDYLIVGVHNDSVVNKHRGLNYPIMNLHERVLSVLGCKHVDDVLIDAPWEVTDTMIASLNISVVVHGMHQDSNDGNEDFSIEKHYKAPIEMGIFQSIDSGSSMTVKDVVARINANHERFERKFVKKMQAEKEYYDHRYAKMNGS